MADSKAFASLSPRLLARKGTAKPAMRPQVAPLVDFHQVSAYPDHEDLGWNDMGDIAEAPVRPAQVVPISGKDTANSGPPAVLAHRKMLARTLAGPARANDAASAKEKRAAFTLRIDPERHFKLRLACSVTRRSAQQLLTEALDTMLAEIPEIQPMASKAGKRR